MVTNYQHTRIRRFAFILGMFLGLYIGMMLGHCLTLRAIQHHGGCIAMPVEHVVGD